MNAFVLTGKSAAHTLGAVFKKGRRDIEVTWEFVTDPEMVALYQAIWQSITGLSYFCYGMGVISRRAMDRLIAESLTESPTQSLTQSPTESEPGEVIRLQDLASDWASELKPMLIESFREVPKNKQVEIIRELGLPWRSRNRRFNREELLEIYIAHLDSL